MWKHLQSHLKSCFLVFEYNFGNDSWRLFCERYGLLRYNENIDYTYRDIFFILNLLLVLYSKQLNSLKTYAELIISIILFLQITFVS